MSIKEKAEKLLSGEVDGVLAYRVVDGSLVPHLFKADDIEQMSQDYPTVERYPLASLVRRLHAQDPEMRLAVVVRGCDERALVELGKQGQVNLDHVLMLGLACDKELAAGCGCAQPYPTEIDEGDRVEGAAAGELVEIIDSLPVDERLAFWLGRFGSCIKCYGCRNICPLCFCKECALEDPELVKRGELPPVEPAFHLIRALDMAGRCIDCGLCEDACPMSIPLRTLYRKVGDVVEDRLGYRPGMSVDEKNPLSILGTEKDLKQ